MCTTSSLSFFFCGLLSKRAGHKLNMSAAVPSSWLYSSSTFAQSFSNPRTESVVQFTPVQDTFTSKSRNLTPIRITCSSPSASFWLQKMFILMDVTLYDATGAVLASGPANSVLGGDAFIESLRITAGGEEVQSIPDYMSYCSQMYKNLPVGHKKLLQNVSGYGVNNIFANSGTAQFGLHPYVGFHHPLNDGPFHAWALPNQQIEYQITLANPANIFTGGTVAEYRVSNVRLFVPITTPPPEYVQTAQTHIQRGDSLFYDYKRASFSSNNCSGGNRSSFLLHLSGVRSLASFSWWFLDDVVLADPTKDKALNFSSEGLKTWQIQLGPNLYVPSGQPFHHGPGTVETLLISQLSNNDFGQLSDLDVDFANYDSKEFSIDYNFESSREAVGAALGFQGTDGIVRLNTYSDPAPSTRVRLQTQYIENVTLAIGQTVQVI